MKKPYTAESFSKWKKKTPQARYIVVKPQKISDKEKNFKSFQREKDRLPTKENNRDDRIVSSTTRSAKREWRNIFKVPKFHIQPNHHSKQRAKERYFQIYRLTTHELLLKYHTIYFKLMGVGRYNGMQETEMSK